MKNKKELVEQILKKYQTNIFNIDHVFINPKNTDKLIVFFAGAVNKYIMLSWFFDCIDYSMLFLKDSTFNCYTNGNYKYIVEHYMNMFNHTAFVGLSMGGIGALLLQENYNISGLLSVDAYPTGSVTDEQVQVSLNKDKNSDCCFCIMSSNDAEDIVRQKQIVKLLRSKKKPLFFEQSDKEYHLGFIPSRLSILNFVNFAIQRHKIIQASSSDSDKHKSNYLHESELWE